MIECPVCGGSTAVVETRGAARRRQCQDNPDHLFSTVEVVAHQLKRAPRGRPPSTRTVMARWQGLT